MDIFSPTAISILADSIPFGRIGVDRSVANAAKTAFGVIVVFSSIARLADVAVLMDRRVRQVILASKLR